MEVPQKSEACSEQQGNELAGLAIRTDDSPTDRLWNGRLGLAQVNGNLALASFQDRGIMPFEREQ